MNIIFDLDSTLCKIEGIDELGALKGVKNEIALLTNDAMCGRVPMNRVFKKRLEIINPHSNDFEKIAKLYLENITSGAIATIRVLKESGHKLFIVTGGYDACISKVTTILGLEKKYVFANEVKFDEFGYYAGLNEEIPLWKNGGKKIIVNKIKNLYPGSTVLVGDGLSDLEAGADIFIYFAGVVRREEVAKKANFIINDLSDIPELLVQQTS